MFSHILIPLDGSKLAEQVIPLARTMFSGLPLHIRLLRVVDPGKLHVLIPDETFYGVRTSHVGTTIDEERKIATDYLETVKTALPSWPFEVHTEVREGRVAEAIAQAASDHNVDMIVMATHLRSGLSKMLLGSVTEEVLRRASKPVLVINPSEK